MHPAPARKSQAHPRAPLRWHCRWLVGQNTPPRLHETPGWKPSQGPMPAQGAWWWLQRPGAVNTQTLCLPQPPNQLRLLVESAKPRAAPGGRRSSERVKDGRSATALSAEPPVRHDCLGQLQLLVESAHPRVAPGERHSSERVEDGSRRQHGRCRCPQYRWRRSLDPRCVKHATQVMRH